MARSTKTPEQSWRDLEASRDHWKTAAKGLEETVRSIDVDLVAARCLEAGFHSFRGRGRLLTETLVARHRARDELLPDIALSDIRELADEYGIEADFAPSLRIDP